ncbi:MAG: helix-turn-helix domain-containing protein [Actinomycetota bacterium]|nr:helix-turn-helix domain-containing protein [Actinomycetota bacterium]
MTAALEQHTILPPKDEDNALAGLTLLLSGSKQDGAALVGPDGTQVPLPGEVYLVLRNVVEAMSHGLAITIAPHNTLLTTQQAADMLSISRPTLVKLLVDGEVPFELRGRHRRVLLADVIAYQERARDQRRAILDGLTRESGEDGLDDIADEIIQTR